jgi:hypothetical protein
MIESTNRNVRDVNGSYYKSPVISANWRGKFANALEVVC